MTNLIPRLALVLALGSAAVSVPATASAMALHVAPCTAYDRDQESRDAAMEAAVESSLGSGGYPALLSRLPDLEAALARAPASLNAAELCDGRIVVRAEQPGLYGALSALLANKDQAAKAWDGKVVPTGVYYRPSPYIRIALLVGMAYDERREYGRGLEALEKGLALDPQEPKLAAEAALALNDLHRPGEALAVCDRVLTGEPPPDKLNRGRLLRTRGFALGDLGRYDEAIQSYQDSLVLEPNHAGALNEIRYLKGRKAGRGDAPVEQTTTGAFKTGIHPSKSDAPPSNP